MKIHSYIIHKPENNTFLSWRYYNEPSEVLFTTVLFDSAVFKTEFEVNKAFKELINVHKINNIRVVPRYKKEEIPVGKVVDKLSII